MKKNIMNKIGNKTLTNIVLGSLLWGSFLGASSPANASFNPHSQSLFARESIPFSSDPAAEAFELDRLYFREAEPLDAMRFMRNKEYPERDAEVPELNPATLAADAEGLEPDSEFPQPDVAASAADFEAPPFPSDSEDLAEAPGRNAEVPAANFEAHPFPSDSEDLAKAPGRNAEVPAAADLAPIAPNPVLPWPNPAVSAPNPASIAADSAPIAPNPVLPWPNPAVSAPNPASIAADSAPIAPNPMLPWPNPMFFVPDSVLFELRDHAEKLSKNPSQSARIDVRRLVKFSKAVRGRFPNYGVNLENAKAFAKEHTMAELRALLEQANQDGGFTLIHEALRYFDTITINISGDFDNFMAWYNAHPELHLRRAIFSAPNPVRPAADSVLPELQPYEKKLSENPSQSAKPRLRRLREFSEEVRTKFPGYGVHWEEAEAFAGKYTIVELRTLLTQAEKEKVLRLLSGATMDRATMIAIMAANWDAFMAWYNTHPELHHK